VSGYVCHSIKALAQYAREIETCISPAAVRRYVEQYFSLERMTAEYEQLYCASLGSKLLTPVSELLEMDDKEPPAA
jgi:hypothetical protein